MGHRISRFFKRSKSNSQAVLPARSDTRYPLIFERQMLMQIKKGYEASKQDGVDENDAHEPTSGHNEDSLTREAFQKTMLEQIMRKFEHGFDEAPGNRSRNDGDLNDYDNNIQTRPFNFIDFPDLVVQKLLTFLSSGSVLVLRETCKTTKNWIDTNRHILRDFEMRIQPEMCDMNHDPPHTSPWSNLAIPFEKLCSLFVEKTVDNFADIIWSLEIVRPQSDNHPPNHPRRLFELIGKCTAVQCLKICRIDSLTELPLYDDCFQCLRYLSIDRIRWMNHSDFLFFETLIMKCPALEYIRVPDYEILGSLSFLFYHQESPPEREYLIRPLIRYLQHYRNPLHVKNLTRLYIDVVALEDFKLCSSEVFYELSRKCMSCNAVLMNVYFVPRDAVLRDEEDIVESFASMFGFIKIDFAAELWKRLETMEIWIEEFPNDRPMTLRQFEFLKTLSKIKTLNSLTIRMSVDNPEICSEALGAFIGQSCDSLKKLVLRRHASATSTFMKIPDGFGKAFTNLAYLYFQEIDCKNEDFACLWPNLPMLEELFVYKCPYLTQEAFIGEPNREDPTPPILTMKFLKILVLFLYEGTGGFDDRFLIQGLRHLKLKGFALRGAAGVVFTDSGMSALLNSPFHETIEDFEAPANCFQPSSTMEYWQFYIALPRKELRKNHLWLSCTLLMSSLSSRRHHYDFKKKCLGI